MTTKPVHNKPDAVAVVRFPDAPPEEMTAYHHVNFPGYPGFLALHFGNPESTVILSEIAAGLFPTASREGIRFPDLLIGFNVRPELIIPRNGYLIPEQGKPPDFVLEVGSETTGRIDEGRKRLDYAGFRVPEYWRFDPSGGDFHNAHLGGDRLIGDDYQPIAIHQTADGHHWGHSDVLNLDICWVDGQLRWYDPVAGRYLATIPEEREALLAERDARLAERNARLAAEARAQAEAARAQQLEEELRRLRGE